MEGLIKVFELIDDFVRYGIHGTLENNNVVLYDEWRVNVPPIFFESPPGEINEHTAESWKN